MIHFLIYCCFSIFETCASVSSRMSGELCTFLGLEYSRQYTRASVLPRVPEEHAYSLTLSEVGLPVHTQSFSFLRIGGAVLSFSVFQSIPTVFNKRDWNSPSLSVCRAMMVACGASSVAAVTCRLATPPELSGSPMAVPSPSPKTLQDLKDEIMLAADNVRKQLC